MRVCHINEKRKVEKLPCNSQESTKRRRKDRSLVSNAQKGCRLLLAFVKASVGVHRKKNVLTVPLRGRGAHIYQDIYCGS